MFGPVPFRKRIVRIICINLVFGLISLFPQFAIAIDSFIVYQKSSQVLFYVLNDKTQYAKPEPSFTWPVSLKDFVTKAVIEKTISLKIYTGN